MRRKPRTGPGSGGMAMKTFGGGNSNEIDVATTLNAKGTVGRMDFESETFCVTGEITHSLTAEGFGASEDGTGRAAPLVPVGSHANGGGLKAVAFQERGRANGRSLEFQEDVAYALTSPKGGGRAQERNIATEIVVAFRTAGDGAAYEEGDKSAPLTTGTDPSASIIAFNLRGWEGGSQPEVSDVASVRASQGGSSRSYIADTAVRRLSVIEVARLQGFPDLYAHIDYGRPRKIAADEAAYLAHHGIKCWQDGEQWMTNVAADGNMYKAYGNSWAIPVIRWIGERINAADNAPKR